MLELALAMPGLVDVKSFAADDGEHVTIATFADEESQRRLARARRAPGGAAGGPRPVLRRVLAAGVRDGPGPDVRSPANGYNGDMTDVPTSR